MTRAKKGTANSIDGRHMRHVTVLDYDALDQMRKRHEAFGHAIMQADKALRKGNVDKALAILQAALKTDKQVGA